MFPTKMTFDSLNFTLHQKVLFNRYKIWQYSIFLYFTGTIRIFKSCELRVYVSLLNVKNKHLQLFNVQYLLNPFFKFIFIL